MEDPPPCLAWERDGWLGHSAFTLGSIVQLQSLLLTRAHYICKEEQWNIALNPFLHPFAPSNKWHWPIIYFSNHLRCDLIYGLKSIPLLHIEQSENRECFSNHKLNHTSCPMSATRFTHYELFTLACVFLAARNFLSQVWIGLHLPFLRDFLWPLSLHYNELFLCELVERNGQFQLVLNFSLQEKFHAMWMGHYFEQKQIALVQFLWVYRFLFLFKIEIYIFWIKSSCSFVGMDFGNFCIPKRSRPDRECYLLSVVLLRKKKKN